MQKTIIAALGAAAALALGTVFTVRHLKSRRNSHSTSGNPATFKDLYEDNEMEVQLF